VRFDVLTLSPRCFRLPESKHSETGPRPQPGVDSSMEYSRLGGGKAQKRRHRPFGAASMVLMCEPMFAALKPCERRTKRLACW